jgi:adenosylmethionine-8-amino-7-oxononanoate aminotransferase
MMSNYTKDLWTKDKDHLLHPWTHFDSFKTDGALVLERGEGSYLYDSDGKR